MCRAPVGCPCIATKPHCGRTLSQAHLLVGISTDLPSWEGEGEAATPLPMGVAVHCYHRPRHIPKPVTDVAPSHPQQGSRGVLGLSSTQGTWGQGQPVPTPRGLAGKPDEGLLPYTYVSGRSHCVGCEHQRGPGESAGEQRIAAGGEPVWG